MSHYDVFNGDADGITSLVQLRLDRPLASTLVTGTKRDNTLLHRVTAGPGDTVTVLDIAIAQNRPALQQLLAAGARVTWFDHHFAGDVPTHPGFTAHLDLAPDVCTGVLVDRYLAGRRRPWAVVAAFGDNLLATAHALAQPLGLGADDLAALHALGDGITYNAYSDVLADAIVPPADLFRTLLAAGDPMVFVRDDPAYRRIDEGRRSDLAQARAVTPCTRAGRADVYLLPDEPWSRRVRGIFGNEVANAAPDRAQAVLTVNGRGGYAVSLRAPRREPVGADAVCRQFGGGGGRQAAAGIGDLPTGDLPSFVAALAARYP
ncbi:MAG: DHHA1 domain-containing protein [Burkholderiales bacterium]